MFTDFNDSHVYGGDKNVYSAHILIARGWNGMVLSSHNIWWLEIPPEKINILYLIPLRYKQDHPDTRQIRKKFKDEKYLYPNLNKGYTLFCHTSDVNAVIVYQEEDYDCFRSGYYYIRSSNANLIPQNRTDITHNCGGGNIGKQEIIPYIPIKQTVINILASRPKSTDLGYDMESNWYKEIKCFFTSIFKAAITKYGKDNIFICSRGALGIEQIGIRAALALGIQVWLFEPFKGVENSWEERRKLEYQNLRSKCIITNLSHGRAPATRREAMKLLHASLFPPVDSCSHVLLFYDERIQSEAREAIQYANKINKRVTMVDLSQIRTSKIINCVQDYYILK